MKICHKCGLYKPYDKFAKDNGAIDMLFSHCKDCQKQYYQANKERLRQWVLANRDKTAVYNKTYRESNKGKIVHSQSQLRYQKREKQWVNNRSWIWKHRGQLLKGQCEGCDSTTELKLVQVDVARPDRAMTLCVECMLKRQGKKKRLNS